MYDSIAKTNFAIAIHNHQPVGNFDSVFENSYRKAYLPFIQTIKKFSQLKVTLHYSGVLLKWLYNNHPDFFDLLKEMLSIGQIELLSGGFFEPILTVLSKKDKYEQIQKMNDFIIKHLDVMPKGLWLAGRVWESNILSPIVDAGLEYVILDDWHLISAGLEPHQTYGYYITEEEGKTLAVFPSNKTLRYLIPFNKPKDTLNFIKSNTNNEKELLFLMGDDGEKFGIWPGTYNTVYKKEWFNSLVKLVESEFHEIRFVNLYEYMKENKPLGLIYIPSSSYPEMMEWALPVKLQKKLRKLSNIFDERQEVEDFQFFFKGGIWKNFFIKYPEANFIHKRMLNLSKRIRTHTFKKDGRRKEAMEYLLQSQCNDAYWHGLFGGLYLPHLRGAIYESLIRAESIIDDDNYDSKDYLYMESEDIDNDRNMEIVLKNRHVNLIFKPEIGGSIVELDYRPKNFNLTNSLTRKEEVYHEDIIKNCLESFQKKDNKTRLISKYDKLKGKSITSCLIYDTHIRASLVDHIFDSKITLLGLIHNISNQRADFHFLPYNFDLMKEGDKATVSLTRDGLVDNEILIRICKSVTILIGDNKIFIRYIVCNLSKHPIKLTHAVEFNLGLLAGHSETHYYNFEKSQNLFINLASRGESQNLKNFRIINKLDNYSIDFDFQKRAKLFYFPIETLSRSESGLEKIYQSSAIFPAWEINMGKYAEWTNTISLSIKDPL